MVSGMITDKLSGLGFTAPPGERAVRDQIPAVNPISPRHVPVMLTRDEALGYGEGHQEQGMAQAFKGDTQSTLRPPGKRSRGNLDLPEKVKKFRPMVAGQASSTNISAAPGTETSGVPREVRDRRTLARRDACALVGDEASAPHSLRDTIPCSAAHARTFSKPAAAVHQARVLLPTHNSDGSHPRAEHPVPLPSLPRERGGMAVPRRYSRGSVSPRVRERHTPRYPVGTDHGRSPAGAFPGVYPGVFRSPSDRSSPDLNMSPEFSGFSDSNRDRFPPELIDYTRAISPASSDSPSPDPGVSDKEEPDFHEMLQFITQCFPEAEGVMKPGPTAAPGARSAGPSGRRISLKRAGPIQPALNAAEKALL